MQDQVVGLIIDDQTVVLTFNDLPADRVEVRAFRGQNQDREVIQRSVIRQEAQTQGYRIADLQGILLVVPPREVQV